MGSRGSQPACWTRSRRAVTSLFGEERVRPLRRSHRVRAAIAGAVVTVAVVLVAALASTSSVSRFIGAGAAAGPALKVGGDPDAAGSIHLTPGEGPLGGYDAYLSAARTYPANVIPPRVV